MPIENYTCETICRAMNIKPLAEGSLPDEPVLRFLLKPSFHPECCITFKHNAEATCISVVCSTESIWQLQSLVPVTCYREEATVPANVFDELEHLFQNALAESQQPKSSMFLDGMSVEASHLRNKQYTSFSAHCSEKAAKPMTAFALEAAWTACKNNKQGDGLAQCAKYVDIVFPQSSQMPDPQVTHVAVLGPPADRADLLETLKKLGKA